MGLDLWENYKQIQSKNTANIFRWHSEFEIESQLSQAKLKK